MMLGDGWRVVCVLTAECRRIITKVFSMGGRSQFISVIRASVLLFSPINSCQVDDALGYVRVANTISSFRGLRIKICLKTVERQILRIISLLFNIILCI